MNIRRIIELSNLKENQKKLILSGIIYAIDIDDKEHEIHVLFKLKSKKLKKLAQRDFETTSRSFFRDEKEERLHKCKLFIIVEEV